MWCLCLAISRGRRGKAKKYGFRLIFIMEEKKGISRNRIMIKIFLEKMTQTGLEKHHFKNEFQKSRVRETSNVWTCADSSNDTKIKRKVRN